jgi:hypothetical protein
MEKMAVHGVSRTTAFDSIITDSAPGMASLISGMKQSNNALQVAVDNTPENPLDNPRIETVFEYMKRVHGWKIGVVTDAFLVDATPAAVNAHNRSRRNYLNIAQQMIGHYDDATELKKTGYTSLAELAQPLDARVFGGAEVRLRGSSAPGPAAQTDALGFFRFRDLAAGSYLVDVALPDGRGFLARVVLLPGRKTQFLELDYARAVPPDDDDDY